MAEKGFFRLAIAMIVLEESNTINRVFLYLLVNVILISFYLNTSHTF